MLRGLTACICRCARRTRAVALVPDRARSAAELPCAAAVVGGLVLAVALTNAVLGGTWRRAACTY